MTTHITRDHHTQGPSATWDALLGSLEAGEGLGMVLGEEGRKMRVWERGSRVARGGR